MKHIFGFFIVIFLLFLLPVSISAINPGGQIVIVLDPGHGGSDHGAVVNGISEYENALSLAQYLKAELEATGKFAVYLTRTDNDTKLTLQQRAAVADRYNADLCVSLHFNSINPSTYCGASVCTSVLDEYVKVELSEQILANLNQCLSLRSNKLIRLEDYGKRYLYWSPEYQWDIYDNLSFGSSLSDYYGMIKWPAKYGIPGIIVEHCCLSNPSDRELIKNESNLALMAKADADAIIAYYCGHEHSFTLEATQDYPTSCLYTGKASRRCTICGCRADIANLASSPDPEKHFWYLTDAKSATCTSDGYRKYSCRYSENFVELYKEEAEPTHTKMEILKATGHSYVITDAKAAGHAQNGYTTYRCSSCGDTYTINIPMTENHTYQLTSKAEPTCTAQGVKAYTCACGAYYEEVSPSLGHHYAETEKVSPTCTENGYILRTCTRCGKTESEVLTPFGHSFSDETDARRQMQKVCSRCGLIVIRETEKVTAPITDPPDTVPSESETASTTTTDAAKTDAVFYAAVPSPVVPSLTGPNEANSEIRAISNTESLLFFTERQWILLIGALILLSEILTGYLVIRYGRQDKSEAKHGVKKGNITNHE